MVSLWTSNIWKLGEIMESKHIFISINQTLHTKVSHWNSNLWKLGVSVEEKHILFEFNNESLYTKVSHWTSTLEVWCGYGDKAYPSPIL